MGRCDDVAMSLISHVHHLATATNDLDRLVAFYREVLELEPVPGHPMETPVGRIAFYMVGGVQLQVVESSDIPAAPSPAPAILLQDKLRLDHFTLHANSKEAFETIRERLVAAGATSGDVQDFQGSDLLAFTDPDGHIMEILFDPNAVV